MAFELSYLLESECDSVNILYKKKSYNFVKVNMQNNANPVNSNATKFVQEAFG